MRLIGWLGRDAAQWIIGQVTNSASGRPLEELTAKGIRRPPELLLCCYFAGCLAAAERAFPALYLKSTFNSET